MEFVMAGLDPGNDEAGIRPLKLISDFQNFFLTSIPNQQYSDLVLSHGGALRNVRNAGSGMRWTRLARLTSADVADGEVVWS
jgi:hypothetical protein